MRPWSNMGAGCLYKDIARGSKSLAVKFLAALYPFVWRNILILLQ